jgi:hypothetical protein
LYIRGGKQYIYFIVPPDYEYNGGPADAAPNRWHYMVGITDLEDEPARPPRMYKGSGCASLWRDQPNFFQHHFDYILCGSFDATKEARLSAEEARRKRALDAIDAKQAAAVRVHAPKDQRRVTDLRLIQQGLEKYIREIGPLPRPSEYGESEPSRSTGFWQHYWDVSSDDGDKDGNAFLDFLVEGGVMPSVPVDPNNEPAADGGPRGGKQYVYMVIPPTEAYEGGTCGTAKNQWVYLLGITDLQSEVVRPPKRIAGSGCDCLWANKPKFFEQHFDYLVCGTFEASPQDRARAEKARQEILAKKAAVYKAQDERRIADLRNIEKAFKTYLQKVGPLPEPRRYGESEHSTSSGFWKGYWDVSGEDGDLDGKPFLDFLVESGTMPSVPVDPTNERDAAGDPRGGKQYVYLLLSPDEKYQGGTCGSDKKEWTYLLGITDLQSEVSRPPRNLSGSGCECLWRGQPNYFQQHFDYVTCGTFRK